jgi:hypothetical protein
MSDPIRNLTEGEVEFFGEHGWLHVPGAGRAVVRRAARGEGCRPAWCGKHTSGGLGDGGVLQAPWPRRGERAAPADVRAADGSLWFVDHFHVYGNLGRTWVRPDDDLRDQRRWLTEPRGQSSAWCQRAALVMG